GTRNQRIIPDLPRGGHQTRRGPRGTRAPRRPRSPGGERARDRGKRHQRVRHRARCAGGGGGAAPADGAAAPRARGAVRAGGRAVSGTVFDIGYRSYDGPREGRSRGRRAVFTDGIRIALGIGRSGRAKILPWFFIFVLAFIGSVMALIAGAVDRLG